MNLNLIAGAILFTLSVIRLLPVIRQRAAERGLSGGYTIPLILAYIGFAVFMIGIFGLEFVKMRRNGA